MRMSSACSHHSDCHLPLSRRAALRLLGAGALTAATGLLAGCGCTPDIREPREVWTDQYDWNAMIQDSSDHRYYCPRNVMSSRFGIDVSDHEGRIDWQQVAADNVEFAMLRVGWRGYTEGGIYEDTEFLYNVEGALSAGIPIGAYFFSSAINADEAAEEAMFVLDHISDIPLTYPVAFDQESVADSAGRANHLPRAMYTQNALAFCQAIRASGRSVCIYGNQHELGRLDRDVLGDCAYWYAEYGVQKPSGKMDFDMWQYSSKGHIKGIESYVDLNIHFLSSLR